MNWDLLITLSGAYTVVFFLLGYLQRPGMSYLKRRFLAELLPLSDENIAQLDPDQISRWEQIYHHDFARTPYRWIEVIYSCFLFPSLILLGAVLGKSQISIAPMYFVTGATYVSISYLLLR